MIHMHLSDFSSPSDTENEPSYYVSPQRGKKKNFLELNKKKIDAYQRTFQEKQLQSQVFAEFCLETYEKKIRPRPKMHQKKKKKETAETPEALRKLFDEAFQVFDGLCEEKRRRCKSEQSPQEQLQNLPFIATPKFDDETALVYQEDSISPPLSPSLPSQSSASVRCLSPPQFPLPLSLLPQSLAFSPMRTNLPKKPPCNAEKQEARVSKPLGTTVVSSSRPPSQPAANHSASVRAANGANKSACLFKGEKKSSNFGFENKRKNKTIFEANSTQLKRVVSTVERRGPTKDANGHQNLIKKNSHVASPFASKIPVVPRKSVKIIQEKQNTGQNLMSYNLSHQNLRITSENSSDASKARPENIPSGESHSDSVVLEFLFSRNSGVVANGATKIQTVENEVTLKVDETIETAERPNDINGATEEGCETVETGETANDAIEIAETANDAIEIVETANDVRERIETASERRETANELGGREDCLYVNAKCLARRESEGAQVGSSTSSSFCEEILMSLKKDDINIRDTERASEREERGRKFLTRRASVEENIFDDLIVASKNSDMSIKYLMQKYDCEQNARESPSIDANNDFLSSNHNTPFYPWNASPSLSPSCENQVTSDIPELPKSFSHIF